MIWAISRGFLRASFAERMATVEAQSPLASSRGRSSAGSGTVSSERAVFAGGFKGGLDDLFQ